MSSVWQILALNLIEIIQSKVWQSFDSLAVQNFINNLTTTSVAHLQNAAAFVLKQYYLAVNPIFGQESSSKLNVYISNFILLV